MQAERIAHNYAVEVIVPVRRVVYVTAATKREAREMAKAGEWYDADPHSEDATGTVRVVEVQEDTR